MAAQLGLEESSVPVLDARYLDDADPAELAALGAILRPLDVSGRKLLTAFSVPRTVGRVEGVPRRSGSRRTSLGRDTAA